MVDKKQFRIRNLEKNNRLRKIQQKCVKMKFILNFMAYINVHFQGKVYLKTALRA